MQPLLLDCSELVGNPIATGIQRVVRELMRGWLRAGVPHEVVRLDPGTGLRHVPAEAVSLLLADGSGQGSDGTELHRLLHSICSQGDLLDPCGSTVLNPEPFYDAPRCSFYESLAANPSSRVLMLAYDFLPWLQPSLIMIRSTKPLMPYLRLLTHADSVGFISDRTRQEYVDRIVRGNARDGQVGPVFPLGSDGLAAPKQTWRENRVGFLCLGSVERRKNQLVVAEAFRQLWSEGIDAPLTICGAAPDPVLTAELERYERFPQFRWTRRATDDVVADQLNQVRATIFLSEAEGFGLPPVESMFLGVPAIVLDGVPSVQCQNTGVVRLPDTSVATVANAVRHLLEHDTLEDLWAETASLVLPTWNGFSAAVASWALSTTAQARAPQCDALAAPERHPEKIAEAPVGLHHRSRKKFSARAGVKT